MAEVSIGAIQRIFNNLINIVNKTLDGYTIGSITPAAGTFTTVNATTLTGALSASSVNNGTVSNATALSVASSTTVRPVTGLTVALIAGGTYFVDAGFPVTAITAGGVNLQLTTPDTLTLTSANLVGLTYSGTTIVADTAVSALSADIVNYANTATLVTLNGTIIVNAAGTLNISAAQHTSNATSSTIQAGSYLSVTRIS